MEPAQQTTIRQGTPEDLKYCVHLHRAFAHALGFIPRAGMERALTAGHVRMALENDTPAGYLLSRRLTGERHIHSIVQAAVAMDAQRRHHGLCALRTLERDAHTDLLQCWCAEDLESNSFWLAAGFRPAGIRDPENMRGRKLILWRKPLTPAGALRLADRPKRAGPHAARPRNLILLTEAQRVQIETSPPEDALKAIRRLGLECPRSVTQADVDQVLRVYRSALASSDGQELAAEIRRAILIESNPVTPPAPPRSAPPPPPRPAPAPTPPPPPLPQRSPLALRARSNSDPHDR